MQVKAKSFCMEIVNVVEKRAMQAPLECSVSPPLTAHSNCKVFIQDFVYVTVVTNVTK